MKYSRQFINEGGTVQEGFLKLAKKDSQNRTISTGTHKVQLLSDEVGTRINFSTKQREEVVWFHLKDVSSGELLKYAIPTKGREEKPHYLLQKLGVLPEKSIVSLTYTKIEGSFRGFIKVELENDTEIAPDESGSCPDIVSTESSKMIHIKKDIAPKKDKLEKEKKVENTETINDENLDLPPLIN